MKQNITIATKLAILRKATIATEKLLFGDSATTVVRVMAKPDLKSLEPKLKKLTKEHEFDCVELAEILTAHAKISPDSKPAQYAAQWLIGVSQKTPPEFQTSEGLLAIQQAVDSGDVIFFIQLGEHLRNRHRNSAKDKKRDNVSDTKWHLLCWWKPIPRLNWPGLAYCNHSAQREFFDLHFPRRACGSNYLDNERRRTKLILSKHAFISGITGTIAKPNFS